MKIAKDLWTDFSSYLFYDRKLSTNPGAKSASKSRFFQLAKAFESQDFNRINFTSYLSELKDKGYAITHINKTITYAKHLDKFLKLNELTDFTYFKEGGLKDRDILTPDEIDRLANVKIAYARYPDAVNLRQKCLILLLGTTGCRIDEALSLRTTDIFSSPCHVIFRHTKNGEERAVPIYKELFDMMVQIKGKDLVFVSYRGGPMNGQQTNLDFKERAKLCLIEKPIYNHLFRHSYITTMLSNGVQWLDLAPIVGHKDPKTTMRYAHFDIAHYTKVALMHPLLKRHMSPQDIIKQVKEAIMSCGINDDRFRFELTDKGLELLFKIEFIDN